MSARLNALLEQRGKIADQMENLHALITEAEKREYTPEEKTAFADLDDQFKAVEEKIEFEKRVEQRKAAAAKPLNLPGQERGRLPAEPRRASYGKQLKAFKSNTFGSQADAEDAAYRAGMWCRATIYGDQGAAQWCNEHDVEIRRELSYGAEVQKTQNENTNSAGGYVVFPEMSTAIIDLREQYGTARRFINVRPMASDTQDIPRRTGGPTAYFAAEENAFTESSKSWGQVQLRAQAVGCLSKISRELAADAVINIADDLAADMAYGLAVKEDATLWNGDGTSSYGGIVGVRTKFAAGVGVLAGAIDAASGHDTFAEYDAADLIKVMGALPKYAEPQARWYGHRAGWANTFLRLIAAAGGNAIIDLQMGGKPVNGYLGYPFETDQTLPSALTDLSDTAIFMFGDLNAAVTMGERQGLTIDVTRDRYWETRQIGIMTWERIDINVHDIGDATNAGPLVALMAE
jgi:HK97 family phage major capsid protein